MEERILQMGKEFLSCYLRDRTIDYEVLLPWRKSWEFIVLHSFRVEGYVRKLLQSEHHNLTQEEVLLTRLAAILHDIGRVHRREEHALLGRDIVRQWLEENKEVSQNVTDRNRLLYLIEEHSNKEESTEDYCLKVLRDADILDEIGVMSIFMTSNGIDKSNPYFFKLLCDKVESFELNFCDEEYKLLSTETARQIMKEKKAFIVNFVNHLKDEMYGTESFDEVTIEDYFHEVH